MINNLAALSPVAVAVTRFLDAASGDVAYTGVGFRPSFIIFLGKSSVDASGSLGADDATNRGALLMNDAGVSAFATLFSIEFWQGAGPIQRAIVKSMDDDGFTLTWEKVGAGAHTQLDTIAWCFRR